MHAASIERDADTWERGNRRFHALLALHAQDRIRETIHRSIDASERYRRIKLRTIPHALEIAEAEHAARMSLCSASAISSACGIVRSLIRRYRSLASMER